MFYATNKVICSVFYKFLLTAYNLSFGIKKFYILLSSDILQLFSFFIIYFKHRNITVNIQTVLETRF